VICHEYLQRKAKLIISPLEQGLRPKGRGPLEADRIGRKESGKRLEGRIEENSLIQEAVRLFDGKIVGK
jgi:hypothetical protein